MSRRGGAGGGRETPAADDTERGGVRIRLEPAPLNVDGAPCPWVLRRAQALLGQLEVEGQDPRAVLDIAAEAFRLAGERRIDLRMPR